jgi:hypothetical protein
VSGRSCCSVHQKVVRCSPKPINDCTKVLDDGSPLRLNVDSGVRSHRRGRQRNALTDHQVPACLPAPRIPQTTLTRLPHLFDSLSLAWQGAGSPAESAAMCTDIPSRHAGYMSWSRFPDPLLYFSESIAPRHRIVSNCCLSNFVACATPAREGGLIEEAQKNNDCLGL